MLDGFLNTDISPTFFNVILHLTSGWFQISGYGISKVKWYVFHDDML